MWGCSASADCDLPPALAEAWFCQLLIVSAIVRCLELREIFRGYINARTEIGGVGGCWLFQFVSSCAQRRCLVTLTPEALGHVSTVAQRCGWGTLLAHTVLPVEGHTVPRRKGQPEMRVDILSATSSPSLLLSLQGMVSRLSRQYSFSGTEN